MTKKELEAKTVAELRDIAGRMRISLASRRKAEIIAELLKAARKAARAARKKTPSEGRKKAAPGAKKTAPATRKAAVPARKKTAPGIKTAAPAFGKRAAPPKKKAPPMARKTAVHRVKGTAPVSREKTGRPDVASVGAVLPSTPGKGEFIQPPVEDRLTAIVVDPRQVFVHWELTEEAAGKGAPVLRVHDITGVDLEKALGFFDISVSTRAGSMYVGLLPEREFLFEIGVIGPRGGFMSLRGTGRLATPSEGPAGEKAVLPEKYFRFTPPRY